jgi:molecular chaperone DnaJ
LFRAAAVACTDCDGKGTIRPKCEACAGTGLSARKTGHLQFEVPAGIRPGASLRVRGHGRRGRSGEAPGDLLVHVGVAPHPLFEPDFPDLRCEMPVSVFRALAGGTLEVPTLGAAVSVPLSSEPVDGAELRIPGHGMLDGASGRRGDLLVRVRLIRPQPLSDTHLALLAELEQLSASDPAHIDWLRRRHDAQRRKSRPNRPPE